MKKSLLSMGMLCIALTLTNCQKEQTETIEPAAEPNFELFAKPTDTKTENDGLNTKWAAGDAINIFHAEAGKASYVSDGQFTLKDAESGKFEGTIAGTLTDGTSYDWYAFYPYTSQIVTPANTNKGWVTVGGTAQTQTGNDSRDHLAGEACPLYGISKSVAKDEVPSIRMENLASVIKVNVTNNSGEELTVSSIAFTGTEDIVGTYYINFAASPVTYKSSGDNYVSATATLSVKDGGAIANGSSAAFYIAIKPFTAKSGSILKLAVNGYEKTITLPSEVTFTAGHIKALGFDFDKTDKTAFFNFADPESLGITKPATSKGTEITDPIVKGDITITATDGSTETRIFNSNNKCDLRVYKDGTLKFSVSEGFKINSISFAGSVADGKVSCDAGSYKSGVWTGEVQSVTFTASATINISSATVSYQKGIVLPALATPEVLAETKDLNSIYTTWDKVDGAKDYTVTCGDKTATTSETEYTFTGLAYSTEYTVSVVANPADATVNAKSAPGTATVTTGANPSGETTTIKLGPDWNKLFGTSYSGSISGVKANALSLIGTSGEVTTSVVNGISTNGYIKTSDFRAYNGYTITLSVPAGKNITKISTTKGGKTFTSGIKADVGTGKVSSNSFSWSGSAQAVKLTISGTVSFETISVTYE